MSEIDPNASVRGTTAARRFHNVASSRCTPYGLSHTQPHESTRTRRHAQADVSCQQSPAIHRHRRLDRGIRLRTGVCGARRAPRRRPSARASAAGPVSGGDRPHAGAAWRRWRRPCIEDGQQGRRCDGTGNRQRAQSCHSLGVGRRTQRCVRTRAAIVTGTRSCRCGRPASAEASGHFHNRHCKATRSASNAALASSTYPMPRTTCAV